jgi:hypothetical protein
MNVYWKCLTLFCGLKKSWRMIDPQGDTYILLDTGSLTLSLTLQEWSEATEYVNT